MTHYLTKKIQGVTDKYSVITLKEMGEVKLMKRVETKFIVNINVLESLLEELKESYKVLDIDNRKIMKYSTLYYDTLSNSFYHEHHNGKVKRTKVRIRKYIESNISFLEIKQKNHKGRTDKSRIPILGFENELSGKSINFIKKITTKDYKLIPTIWTNFNRITLVNVRNRERITIDLNVSFKANDIEKVFENLVIIELKQTRFNRNSLLVKSLKKRGVNPYRISKYCVGMMSLNKGLKYNNFKQKVLKINKISA